MNYLFDTHAWIWWHVAPERLSAVARHRIEKRNENEAWMLSAISLWEVCKLIEKGRLQLTCDVLDWLHQAASMPGLRIIELSFEIAYQSTTLPRPFHNDPADQIIAATARLENATILTSDRKLRKYPHVKTLW
jgi:PIN domain nuclease of toxin-antitoxin system